MPTQNTELQNNSNKLRENKILEVIMSYARLDFSKKTIISDKGINQHLCKNLPG